MVWLVGGLMAACAAEPELVGRGWSPAAPRWEGALVVQPLDAERVRMVWPAARDEATPAGEMRYRWQLAPAKGQPIADEARGVTSAVVAGLIDARAWQLTVQPVDGDGLNGPLLGPLAFELPSAVSATAALGLTDVTAHLDGAVLTVHWRALGATAAVRCSVGDVVAQPCSVPWQPAALAPGPHLVVLTPLDAAGRSGMPWFALVEVAGDPPPAAPVDRIAPNLTVTAVPASPSWTPWPSAAWVVDDPAAAVECSDDGAAWAPCTSPRVLAGAAGFRSLALRAVDTAGNRSAESTLTWVQADCSAAGAWCTEAGRDASALALDDAPAGQVVLQWPAGVATTADGRVAVADAYGGRIWLFTPDGRARRIAGDGRTMAVDPDGPDARRRAIGLPWGIVLEAGRVVFSDARYHCLRAVDLETGTLSTLAGACGSYGFADGSAASARFYGPRGLARTADGTIYVADTWNHRIRRLKNGVVATIAGTGTDAFGGDGGAATLGRLSMPYDVTPGPAGRSLYVADYGNNRVRQVDFALAPAVIRTVIGDGSDVSVDGVTATATGLARPLWVAFPEGGQLHVGGDAGSGHLVSLTADGRLRIRLPAGHSDGNAGNGGLLAAALLRPHLGAAALGGDLVVAGRRSLRAIHGERIYAFGGPADDQAPPLAGLPAVQATLVSPEALAVAADGTRFVLDRGIGRIVRIVSGRIVGTLGPELDDPRAMLLDEERGRLYVSEVGRHRVVAVAVADGVTAVVAGTGSEGISDAAGAAVDLPLHTPWGLSRQGRDLWVVDRGGHCVRQVDLDDGSVATYAGACGAAGNLNAADPRSARFTDPSSLAGDAAGTLWIFDAGNRKIRRLRAGGTATVVGDGSDGPAVAGAGTASPLRNGRGLVWDAVGRRVMFGQTGGLWGLTVDDGQIALWAGGSENERGFHGGSGGARSARMVAPGELSAFGDGALAVPDPFSGRVMRWQPD
jgi:sugar lactone lactonase YvrE